MPIFDYECAACHQPHEVITGYDDLSHRDCPYCGAKESSRRIISASGYFTGNQDAAWIKSVLDVVDVTSTAPHVREFVKNPNRRTYGAWMKGEGLRPLEAGEARKPPQPDFTSIDRQMWDRHRKRKRIEIK